MPFTSDETLIAVGMGIAAGLVSAITWFFRLVPWKAKVDKEIEDLKKHVLEHDADIKEILGVHLRPLKNQAGTTAQKVDRILGLLEGEEREMRRRRSINPINDD